MVQGLCSYKQEQYVLCCLGKQFPNVDSQVLALEEGESNSGGFTRHLAPPVQSETRVHPACAWRKQGLPAGTCGAHIPRGTAACTCLSFCLEP